MSSPLAAIVLAAGQGTRMKSDGAKVLLQLSGEPLVAYPIRLAQALHAQPVVLVVGHQKERVEADVARRFPGTVTFAEQREQKGTGHAVMEGMRALEGFSGRVLILYGDVPLLAPETIKRLLREADAHQGHIAIVTTEVDNPRGYGRIVRDASRRILRIVEEKDATDGERAIREINAGIYAVDSAFLRSALARLRNDNAQREYYLTDIIGLAIEAGHTVGSVVVEDPSEVLGANTRAELAQLERLIQLRTLERWMREGVSIVAPELTFISPHVRIGRDTVIQPGVHLRGQTVIGERCVLDVGVVITDGHVADEVEVKPYTVIENATVSSGAIVGPFSRLRPGAEVGRSAHVGNFVELKNTTLGEGSKANHLAYLGDATIGAGSNIGAGTITCNYDGFGKYRTKIGDGVFVGSNATLVAPVELKDRAYVAAGSAITKDVGPDDLAFGRARQEIKPGRAASLRQDAEARARGARDKSKKSGS